MDANVDQYTTQSRELTEIPVVLEKWYAAHSTIRRLRAVSGSGDLTVFVSIEPTSDGDDALPVWLANHRRWVADLSARTRREVRLELASSTAIAGGDLGVDAVIISELTWRDSWSTT